MGTKAQLIVVLFLLLLVKVDYWMQSKDILQISFEHGKGQLTMKNIDKVRSLDAESLGKVLLTRANIPKYIDVSNISNNQAMALWLNDEFTNEHEFKRVFNFVY